MAKASTASKEVKANERADTAPPPAEKAPRVKKPIAKTVELWAAETGNVQKIRFSVDVGGVAPNRLSAKHRTAAHAHGWDEDARQGHRPIRLTKEDYLAALKAAQGCDERGEVCTHAPAVSEHHAARVAKAKAS